MEDLSPSTSVFLHNWWLTKSEGADVISISGIAVRGEECQSLFKSAPITKRHESGILEASDGCMIYISGFINRSQMQHNGFPSQFCSHFQIGFPYDWEDYVSQYFNRRFEEKVRNVPLPVLHKLPVTQAKDFLMSMSDNEFREVRKQLFDDLISRLRAIPAESSVLGTAKEQNPNVAIAVASEVNEPEKDGLEETSTTRLGCKGGKNDMEIPSESTLKGGNAVRRSSMKVGIRYPCDITEANQESREDANVDGCPPERYGGSKQNPDKEQNSDVAIAVASEVNEAGKDGSEERPIRPFDCTGIKSDMEMPNEKTLKGDNAGRRWSRELGIRHQANKESREDANADGCLPERYGGSNHLLKVNERGDSEKLYSSSLQKLVSSIKNSSRKRKLKSDGFKLNVDPSGITRENIKVGKGVETFLSVKDANGTERCGPNYLPVSSPWLLRNMRTRDDARKNDGTHLSSSCDEKANHHLGKKNDVDVSGESSNADEHVTSILGMSSRQSRMHEAACKENLRDRKISVKEEGANDAHYSSTDTILPCRGGTEDMNTKNMELKSFLQCPPSSSRRSCREKKPIARFF